MRIWHWSAIVLIIALLLAIGRAGAFFAIVVVVFSLGAMVTVPFGLALGRHVNDTSPRAMIRSWLLGIAIVLIPLVSLMAAIFLTLIVLGDD